MSYEKLPLLDGETAIDKKLLDHIQDGIVDAQKRIDNLGETVQTLEDTVITIVLHDESQPKDVTDAIAAYRTGANVFWKEYEEWCGCVGSLTTPPALYFMKTSENRIVRIAVEDGIVSGRYYSTSGDSIQAVQTATEMERILAVANRFDIGTFYMYIGTDTTVNGRTYKQGTVYRLGEKE